MRVLHIISGLGLGGAETLFYNLCSVWARDKNNEHIVISFTENKYFDFDKLGITCYVCPIAKGPALPWEIINIPWRVVNLPRPILDLRRKIKTIQPDIIKAWMYHACLFTHLVASAKIPQIWGIHDEKLYWYDTLSVHILERVLLWLQTDSKPDKIIFVSDDSIKYQIARGYMAEKATVIHNGVDTEKFYPSQKMRADKRMELGIDADTFLIGNFCRFNEQKNHRLLANVFAEILKKHGQARFVLAGPAIDNQNTQLMEMFSDPVLQGKIMFLGARRDITELFNAIDCFVLTSHSEAFPIVLLEACACGVPIIGNNVGEVGKLILNKQFLIDSGKAQDFVAGIEQVMSWQNEELQQYADKSRQLVQDNFSIETTAEKYMNVFKQVLE